MNPSELRRGNLFNPIYRGDEVHLPLTGIILQVMELHTFHVVALLDHQHDYLDHERQKFKYSDMSPIPITAEWLNKFGFREASFLQEAISDPNEMYYQTTLRMDSQVFTIKSYTRFKYEYVHQLQNIYFALSGKELKLKPKTNGRQSS